MTSITPITEKNNLKRFRQARGLAQYGLATLAQTSPSTIVAAERWGYVPSPVVRQRLAAALDVNERDIWPHEKSQQHAITTQSSMHVGGGDASHTTHEN